MVSYQDSGSEWNSGMKIILNKEYWCNVLLANKASGHLQLFSAVSATYFKQNNVTNRSPLFLDNKLFWTRNSLDNKESDTNLLDNKNKLDNKLF